MKALLICAHPDDLEYSIPSLMITLAGRMHKSAKKNEINIKIDIQKGRQLLVKRPNEETFEIKVACMTRGEMSGFTDIVKSTLLAARVRTKELEKSEAILIGQKPDFLGYFDGYIEICTESIQKIKHYIQKSKPDLVIAPEPWLAWYHHPDHVKTGIIVYYALQKLKKELEQPRDAQKIPALYYFQSLANDWRIPRYPSYNPLIEEALQSHQSQRDLLRVAKIPAFFEQFVLGLGIESYRYAEGLRHQALFLSDEKRYAWIIRRFKHLHWIRRIVYYLGKFLTSREQEHYAARYRHNYTGTLPPTT